MSGVLNMLGTQEVPSTCRLVPMIASLVSWGSVGERLSDEGAVLWAGPPGRSHGTVRRGDRSAGVSAWEGHPEGWQGRCRCSKPQFRGTLPHCRDGWELGPGEGLSLSGSLGTGLPSFLWSEETDEPLLREPLRNRIWTNPHPTPPVPSTVPGISQTFSDTHWSRHSCGLPCGREGTYSRLPL